MAGKCSRNGMKVGVRCCFVVGRPPAKFHRVRSPFDAPTDNYSGNIVGLTSDVFGLRKQSSGLSLSFLLSARALLHSPLPTARSNLTSLVSPRPSSRARPKIVPDPTRAVATVVSGASPNVYKMSPFSYMGYLAYLFSTARLRSDGPSSP